MGIVFAAAFYIQPSNQLTFYIRTRKLYVKICVLSEISPGGNDNITKQYQENDVARSAGCLQEAILELNYLSTNVFGYLFLHFMGRNELLR